MQMLIEHLEYPYRNTIIALPGSYTLSRGELVQLAGVNGSGKSTILKILAGLLTNYRGICERPATWSIRYVPTSIIASLFLPWYTVRQNIDVLLSSRSRRESAIEFCARHLGAQKVSKLLDQPAHEPSAGEAATVAIGCGLASGPQLLLLDETLSYLAPALAKAIGAELEDFAESGGIVVVAGHHELPFCRPVRVIEMPCPY